MGKICHQIIPINGVVAFPLFSHGFALEPLFSLYFIFSEWCHLQRNKPAVLALMVVPSPAWLWDHSGTRGTGQRYLSSYWYIPNTFSQLLVGRTIDFLSWRHIALVFKCLKHIFLPELVQRGCCRRFDTAKCRFLKSFEGSIENGCVLAKGGCVGTVCAVGWEVSVALPRWYSPGVAVSSLALWLLFASDAQGNTKLITTTIYYVKLNKKAIMVPDCH